MFLPVFMSSYQLTQMVGKRSGKIQTVLPGGQRRIAAPQLRPDSCRFKEEVSVREKGALRPTSGGDYGLVSSCALARRTRTHAGGSTKASVIATCVSGEIGHGRGPGGRRRTYGYSCASHRGIDDPDTWSDRSCREHWRRRGYDRDGSRCQG